MKPRRTTIITIAFLVLVIVSYVAMLGYTNRQMQDCISYEVENNIYDTEK